MIKLTRRILSRFSTKQVTILESTTDDIYFNLATQEYLYNTDLNTPTLFLWRNNKTIVIGRHQNPWKQCHLNLMEKDGIVLSRRITGGGAVYHDLGNTCFSFLTPYENNEQYDYKSTNNQILLDSLKGLGIQAEVSGRNDLTCQGKKISGSAYKINLGNAKLGTGKKSLHHGTVLFDVDTNALIKYLNPNKAKLLSKGISSVASRVLNLSTQFPSANHQTFKQSLVKSFLAHYSPSQINRRILDYSELKLNPIINSRFQQLKSWNWLYGKTPNFTNNLEHGFDWGIIDINFDVTDGVIQNGVVYSDSLNPDFISTIDRILKEGKLTYDFEGIKILGDRLNSEFKDKETRNQIGQLCQWLKQAM